MMIAQRSHWQFRSRTVIFVPLLVLALAACGGGGSKTNYFEPGGDGDTGGTGGNTGGGGGTNTPPQEEVLAFGAIMDGSFVEGQVDVAVDTLSAGGTTEVTVNLVNQNGDPATEEQTVAFTSRCVSDGTATLETGITTIGGQAVAEYVSNGCVGEDEVRATVNAGGRTLTAIGTVVVEQEAIGSLEFVGADPAQIALAGTGGEETSRVTFRLVGQAGGAIQGATVDFELNSETGGLYLTTDSGVTNKAGEVSTVVGAGTVATSVRVTATEQSTGISTQSSQLVVSTGIPDSDSFSLSVDTFNPDAWNYDGTQVEFTLHAADAYNNPVPDGTAVSFYAEGGAIDPSCTTVNGVCNVTWRSQNPRSTAGDFDGRTTIVATAIGNESFTDSNGNGRFDPATEAFDDLSEAYADVDEDDSDLDGADYDVGEFFVDFGRERDGVWNPADGAYNGVLCADTSSAECSEDKSVIVWQSMVIAMSSDVPSENMLYDSVGSAPIALGATVDGGPLYVRIADVNENAMPVGTTVTVAVTEGLEASGSTSYTVPNTLTPSFLPLAVRIKSESEDDPVTTGNLTITTTTPRGVSYTAVWDVQL